MEHPTVFQLDYFNPPLPNPPRARRQKRIVCRRLPVGNVCYSDLLALALVMIDGTDLARIGHQHAVTKLLEKPARPRAVHPDFHHNERFRIPPAQRREARARVCDRFLLRPRPWSPTRIRRVCGLMLPSCRTPCGACLVRSCPSRSARFPGRVQL